MYQHYLSVAFNGEIDLSQNPSLLWNEFVTPVNLNTHMLVNFFVVDVYYTLTHSQNILLSNSYKQWYFALVFTQCCHMCSEKISESVTITLVCPPKVKVQPVLMLSCFAHYSWIKEYKDMKLR